MQIPESYLDAAIVCKLLPDNPPENLPSPEIPPLPENSLENIEIPSPTPLTLPENPLESIDIPSPSKPEIPDIPSLSSPSSPSKLSHPPLP